MTTRSVSVVVIGGGFNGADAGFSGRGFTLSPVTGRMVAGLVMHGDSKDHPAGDFRAGRLAEGGLLTGGHPYEGRAHQ